MFKTSAKTKFVITGFLTIALFIALGTVIHKQNVMANKEAVDIYFLDPVTNTLMPETHYIEKGENSVMAQDVLKILYEGPSSKNLVKVFPSDLKVLSADIIKGASEDDFMFKVVFSPEYYNMSPGEEMFFRGSLVWTMTDLPFIDSIQIFVGDEELSNANGEPMGLLSRNNVIINPVISPDKIESQNIKLYFVDSDTQKLVLEERTVQVNPDIDIENYVMEQLIAGPESLSLSPSVPAETEILGDVATEEGICYVNLSNDFVDKNSSSPELLKLSIYSIVNSLTELPNVKKVQFLIEAEKVENFKGAIDISKPIERDESMILE